MMRRRSWSRQATGSRSCATSGQRPSPRRRNSATSPTYKVKVDAISKPVPTGTQSYALKSKDPRLGEENLRYHEAADFIRTALSGKGLYEAPSEERADMIVELEYGMDAPRSKVE